MADSRLSRQIISFVVPNDNQDHVFRCCPSGEVIHVGQSNGAPNHMAVWIDQIENPTETWERTFRVFRTGDTIPPNYRHKGSALAGSIVNHLYEYSLYPRA